MLFLWDTAQFSVDAVFDSYVRRIFYIILLHSWDETFWEFELPVLVFMQAAVSMRGLFAKPPEGVIHLQRAQMYLGREHNAPRVYDIDQSSRTTTAWAGPGVVLYVVITILLSGTRTLSNTADIPAGIVSSQFLLAVIIHTPPFRLYRWRA
jgi:hypothetical protein